MRCGAGPVPPAMLLAMLACSRSTPPVHDSPRSPPPTAAPADANVAPATPPPPTTTTTRTDDGRCDPSPKVGEPCGEGDSYCVESWGTPGGGSTALWCRDGRWMREEERNLPADEGAEP